MDERTLARLLDDVAAGTTPVADAVEVLRTLPYEAVPDARVDHHRELRTGHPEAIYGPGKTLEQIRDIAASLAARASGAVLLTRATPEQAAAAVEAVPGARYHEQARLVVVKSADDTIDATVAVVAAGTSDLPVAEEAAISLEAAGIRVERITDVGVAGVHRILEHRAALQATDCAIVVAGMEGALPSVVAGLISTPIVAVPTSVGYGASFEGLSALLTMLASCAPGVAVVNIDNGFGAAQVAHRIVRAGRRAAEAKARRMRLLYFDCIAGISGDMALGALIDAGADLEPIRKVLEQLPLEPFELDVEAVETGGIGATKVHVRTSTEGLIRTYASIRSLLDMAEMPLDAKAMAQRIFRRLAEAEAMVHRRDLDQVTFHEVGAVDSIVDIVGTALALASLKVDRVFASAVPTGMGMVKTEHGLLPIPAPAVLELLRGAPMYSRNVSVELVTPTGAAILASLVEGFGELPNMRVEHVGYGAGSARLDFPNVVRVVVGEAERDTVSPADETPPGTELVLETNVDDLNPELYSYVLERLFAAGAQDAWLTPIVMKKGRPAIVISVLVSPSRQEAVRQVLFRETGTLGIRTSVVDKQTLERDWVEVDTQHGSVRVKIGRLEGSAVTVAPEFEDCVKVAREAGVPARDVYEEATRLAREAIDE